MGTRGLVGVRIDGVDKLTYNHFDSYPSGLGQEIVEYLRNVSDMEEEIEKARKLQLVQEGDKPSRKDMKKYIKYADLNVGSRKANDWYCLLRNLQGDLPALLNAGVMIDSAEFINDSLFCEWGYIVNFDDMILEVYKGFQQKAHSNGRYASVAGTPDRGYYPCALVKTFHLNNLPSNLDEALKEKFEFEVKMTVCATISWEASDRDNAEDEMFAELEDDPTRIFDYDVAGHKIELDKREDK